MDSIAKVLEDLRDAGKGVTVVLDSGEEITGFIDNVSPHVLDLFVSGQHVYVAIAKIETVTPVEGLGP